MKTFILALTFTATSAIGFGQDYSESEFLLSEFWSLTSADINQNEKDSLLTEKAKEVINSYDKIEPSDFEDFMETYRLNNKNPNYRAEIDMLYEGLSSFYVGKVVPNFTFEDVQGNKVELHSFKGKPLFIDVWASFCSPCMKQIDSFNALNQKYDGINFIAISNDMNTVNWKRAIELKKFNTIHLIDLKNRESDFSLYFKIRMIPRYIIIDKDMKLISEKAYKPDDSRLIDLLDKQLVIKSISNTP